jgi:hypothetical protein
MNVQVRLLRSLFWLVLGVTVAQNLQAQVVVGRVLDQISGSPIRLANIQLLAADGAVLHETVADSAGRFRVAAPRPGDYRISARALGYSTLQTSELRLDNRVEMLVEVQMSAAALPVQPLRVLARRTYGGNNRLAEYQRRAEWTDKSGLGKVIQRADIERMRPSGIEPLLNTESVRITGIERIPVARNLCDLDVYLDGTPVSYREFETLVKPEDLEGIEIYRGIHEIPPEYSYRTGCGLLLAWTRTDARKSKLTWPKLAIGAAMVSAIVLAASSSN